MEDLSEELITELATYQISASEMEAYTIEKDFKTTGTPTKACVYTEVPELTTRYRNKILINQFICC
jgi:hypothetical protein